MNIKIDKPVAIIDIDGCVCSLTEAANRKREAMGLPPIAPPTSWDWAEATPEERDFMLKGCYADPAFYITPRPLPYAKNALWFLSHHYEIVFMTSRAFYQRDADNMSQEIADITATWLRKWEMPEHRLVHTRMSDKGYASREMFGNRVAFAVDDSPHAIGSFEHAGIFTYVVGYPYNAQYQDGALIKRVSTFAEIAAHRVGVDVLAVKDAIDTQDV